MKRWALSAVGAAGLFLLSAFGAGAQSTINTAVPAQGGPIASAPIRNNFAAAATDINNLLSMFAGVSPPSTKPAFSLFANTGATPNTISVWDGNQYVLYGTLDRTGHVYGAALSSASITGDSVIALSFSGGKATVSLGLVPNGNLVNSSTTVNGQTCTLGSTCTITASAGTITPGVTTIASGTPNGLLYDNGGLLGNLATGNNGVLVTDGSGNPSISSTLPAVSLVNATSLPISTGVSGLGTGVATFLASPTTANFAAAVTGETGTGAVVFGTGPSLSGVTLTGVVTVNTNEIITSNSASALVVGPNGTTNPTLQVVANVGSAATGLQITGEPSGSGIFLTTLSSATNDSLSINAKGSGTINIAGTSTGVVSLGAAGGGVTMTAPITESGAASGTCSSGWGENSSHQLILTSCPGVASSVQIGVTTVTSGTTLNVLYNNAGTLANATITGPLQLSAGALSINGTFTAHGVLIAQGTGALTNVAPAGTGAFLGGNGASADPFFFSGPWTLVATVSLSGGSITDTTHLTSTYNEYEIRINGLIPAASDFCLINLFIGGSLQSSGYLNAFTFGTGGAPSALTSTVAIPCSGTSGENAAAPGISGAYRIKNPSVSGIHPLSVSDTISTPQASGTPGFVTGAGYFNTAGVVTGFQICNSTSSSTPNCSSTFTAGNVEIYGRL